jgi:hypothetical protein
VWQPPDRLNAALHQMCAAVFTPQNGHSGGQVRAELALPRANALDLRVLTLPHRHRHVASDVPHADGFLKQLGVQQTETEL